MTLKSHDRLCLLVSVLALLAFGLAFFPAISDAMARKWAGAAAATLIFGYVSSQLLSKHVFGRESGKEKIGDSRFEAHAMVSTLWLPIIACGLSILAMLYFQVAPEKIGFVLVAVAGGIGHNLSNMRDSLRFK